jgi:hypothetical protein
MSGPRIPTRTFGVQPLRHIYSLHGLTLTVRGDPAAAALLHARLRGFPSACLDDHADLTLEFWGSDVPEGHPIERPSGPARPVYDYLPVGEVLYFDSADCLYADYGGRVRVVADLSDGIVRISFLRSDPRNAFIAAHSLFNMLLMEFAKRRRRYPLHAAAVCVGDRTLVLPGGSGAGKTTLILALLRAGFDLMADDMVFFFAGDEGMRVLGFPDTAGLTGETLTLFPEAETHLCLEEPARLRKQLVRPENVYASTVRMTGRPIAVVFPRVAHADTSVLVPLGQDEAFHVLLGQLRPTEVRSSQGHLDCLARLATLCPSYRLETGRDLDAVSSLLRRLLP